MSEDAPPPDIPEELFRIASVFSRAVKPITRAQEGSRKRALCGSALLIQQGAEFAAVTAAHVVEGDLYNRYLGLAERAYIPWPRDHTRMIARTSGVADPDLAYVMLDIPTEAEPGTRDAFPLTEVVTDLTPEASMGFLAMGYPASLAKIRPHSGTLTAGLAQLAGRAIGLSEYPDLNLDARVHLAMAYEPAGIPRVDGLPVTGPKPNGMSGGALLLTSVGTDGSVRLALAGVLTEYRTAPQRVLVATRIEALLDRAAPRRPPQLREFVRRKVANGE